MEMARLCAVKGKFVVIGSTRWSSAAAMCSPISEVQMYRKVAG
jgi:hypothetical protein